MDGSFLAVFWVFWLGEEPGHYVPQGEGFYREE